MILAAPGDLLDVRQAGDAWTVVDSPFFDDDALPAA